MESRIPVINLGSSPKRAMPVIGLGMVAVPPVPDSETKQAAIDSIELGYRHFDTAFLYQTEKPLGEAIEEALRRGLVKSRDELFITSKLWCSDAHPDLVLPALQKTLRNLGLEWIDLYLIHWPLRTKQGKYKFPISAEDLLPLDLKPVWEAMEECQRLGLCKSIGVSNFSCRKLDELLAFAKIPPAVNQVEMNPLWQQKELREYCKEKGIHVSAYSPLGGTSFPGSKNQVMESEVLKEIAMAKGKTLPQVCVRWLFEQGVSVIVKSFKKERMKENIQIFDWELDEEELLKINQIPQRKKLSLNVSIRGEVPSEMFPKITADIM